MIYPVTMYAAKCDNCGKKWDNGFGLYAYDDQDGMEVQLENDEWIEKDGKNYCPECISFDDEDNLVLKNISNKDHEKGRKDNNVR